MSLTSDRSGKVKVTTLILLVLIAAGAYYGYAFGGVYWRRYLLVGTVESQLAYAGQLADETIRTQMVSEIQELNLPPAASRVRMVRTAARTMQVSISYTETVNLLYGKKDIAITVTEKRTY